MEKLRQEDSNILYAVWHFGMIQLVTHNLIEINMETPMRHLYRWRYSIVQDYKVVLSTGLVVLISVSAGADSLDTRCFSGGIIRQSEYFLLQ